MLALLTAVPDAFKFSFQFPGQTSKRERETNFNEATNIRTAESRAGKKRDDVNLPQRAFVSRASGAIYGSDASEHAICYQQDNAVSNLRS
jgi:hypothetical protein